MPVQREEVGHRARADHGGEPSPRHVRRRVISEAEHAVLRDEEEVVVEKSVVPKVACACLETDVSTSERTVDETLRKEQIDIERETEQEQ